MSRFWHMLIFFCYVTLATAVGVLAHSLIPGIEVVVACLVGLSLFLTCALLHEAYSRRIDSVTGMRRILLLKRALDRNRDELSVARDEIRRLFEALEDGGGERLATALDSLVAQSRSEQDRSPQQSPPAPSRRPTEAEDARSLLERMALADEEEELQSPAADMDYAPVKARPTPHAPPPDRFAAADKSLREAGAEVRVLHNLVEQLYAGRDKPPVSLSEDSVSLRSDRQAREPTLGSTRLPSVDEEFEREEARFATGGGGLAQAVRGSLRIVSDTPVKSKQPARSGSPDSEKAIISTVRDALREDRVDLYLQPIVSLPQRKRRFYECFSRIRASDGSVIGPDRYIDIARSAGLLTAIDNMLLFRCVQLLRKLRRKDFSAAFFCNIAPHTLSDREFFRDFIEYMESHSELAPNLVLEFSQSDLGADLTALSDDLDRLGGLGYRFSLDGVEDFGLDLDALEENRFAYIKIDSRIVLQRLKRGGIEAAELRSLKQDLDGRGIDLIVDRIETEATLLELLDFNIDFGQGYLFGEPRLSKEPGAT